MATKKPASAGPKTPRKPRRKKVAAGSRGLSATDAGAERPADGDALAKLIAEDGGAALAVYREPLGGHTIVLASLPIDKVEPTPYQRDLSEPHVKRLATAMERVDRYLDPMIAVRQEGRYWTPNGNHRLGASRLLGAKAVIALVLPEPELAFQILALNTEKAHNLKERSLEVIRMYRGMITPSVAAGGEGRPVEGRDGKKKETELAPLFEEPGFATFGICYEQRPRYSAGAYNPIVKRVDGFMDLPLDEALKVREARAAKLLAFDDAVGAAVAQLKERGLQSPYLKNFVVARVNYLRFKPGPAEFDPTLDKMIASVAKIDLGNVKREDLARMGGAPAEAGDDE